MANKNEYSTVIPLHMQLCTYSYYCNIKQSVGGISPPFLLLLCKAAAMLLLLCTLNATLLQLLHTSVLQAILFAVMQKKRATVPPQTTPRFLDACIKQGLVGERSERKSSNVLHICSELLTDDEEKHASATSATCQQTAAKPQVSTCNVYMP